MEGAPTAIIGNFSLYHMGFYAWLIAPGVTGTITFEVPVSQLAIFARRENAAVAGTVEFLDVNGDVIFSSVPAPNGFVELVLPAGSPPAAQLRVVNTGTTGFISLDTISFCAADSLPEIGTPICGPSELNSAGFSSTLRAAGSRFAQANALTLTADSLPSGSTGLLLASQAQAFVTQPGGSQGNLCLGGEIGRFVGAGQIMNSGIDGTFSLDIDLANLPSPTGFVSASAGETWTFQAWYRDSVGGNATSNFTDAIAIELL